jgi:Rieske Fe-S protein
MKTSQELFEEALVKFGKTAEEVLRYPNPTNDDEEADNAAQKQKYISRLIRNGYKADFNNENEKKWFPVFIKRGSRWVFSDSDYGYGATCTHLGSRFAFKTENDSNLFGKSTEDLYNITLSVD